MYPSSQLTVRNHANLMTLKSKLQSLEKSFKNNSLYITDREIDRIKDHELHSKITAWNWSKSFAGN